LAPNAGWDEDFAEAAEALGALVCWAGADCLAALDSDDEFEAYALWTAVGEELEPAEEAT
jgi:hypothetical protein